MSNNKNYARQRAELLLSHYPDAQFPSAAETIAQMAAVGFYWIEQGRTFKPFPIIDRLSNNDRILISPNSYQ